MLFAFGDLLLEEEFSPGAMENGLVGVFEKALMQEVGPAPAAMDPVLVFAAALGDRGNAAVLLEGGGTLVAGAFAAEGTAESGCEGGPGAGKLCQMAASAWERKSWAMRVSYSLSAAASWSNWWVRVLT